jgi:hypothetical protein
MTGWDILAGVIKNFPPVAAIVLLVTAAIIFIVGFSKRGMNFIKYGFGQTALDSSLEKRFDELAEKMASKDDIARLDAKIESEIGRLDARIGAIETNHFGHLKNYLGILNGVLLDKQIIDNETKARLDNELRSM